MILEIRNIFWDSTENLMDWIDWFSINLNPFPVQVDFLLDSHQLETVLQTKLAPFNPIIIFGVYGNDILIGSIVITIQIEDDSAEITHLIIDEKNQKTYLSGIALLEIGKFVDKFMNDKGIIYAQTSIPKYSSALEKALLKFNWDRKAVLNYYQKVRSSDKTFRRDVIYFEKIYNKNLL